MATGWPGTAVSLKIKYQRISSIHLHILMDLALGGHGGIVLWKDKWQIQEIQTNLKLFKIWGELISSAWLKQVCVKALVVADYSQPSGHTGMQSFMVWAQSCTNITKFLLDMGWCNCLAPLCDTGFFVGVLWGEGICAILFSTVYRCPRRCCFCYSRITAFFQAFSQPARTPTCELEWAGC